MSDEKDTQAQDAPAEEKKEEQKEQAAPEAKEEAAGAAEEKKEEKKEEEKPAPEEKEEVKEEAGEDVEVPDKFKNIVDAIENMPVLELNELVKLLEKKFGVSAAAVAVAGTGGGAAEEEGSSKATIELTSVGDGKVAVIKMVKEILGVGLKEAKDLTDAAPSDIKKDIEKAEAEEIKAKLEEVGATVTLK